MVDLLIAAAAQSPSTAEHVLTGIVALATLVIGVVWAVVYHRRHPPGPPPSEAEIAADKAQEAEIRQSVRSLVIAAYSFGAVGIALMLLSLIKTTEITTLFNVGVAFAVVGMPFKWLADFRSWRGRRRARNRAKSQ